MSSRRSGSFQELGRSFEVLQHLDSAQLKQILNSDSRIDDLVSDHPVIRDLATKREELITQNRSLADYALSRERKLQLAKDDLNKSHLAAQEKRRQYEQMHAVKARTKNDPETILALLQAAAAEADDESDQIAEKATSGLISMEEFLDKFMKKRIEAHILHTKEEKLGKIVQTGNYRDGQTF